MSKKFDNAGDSLDADQNVFIYFCSGAAGDGHDYPKSAKPGAESAPGGS